MWRNKKLLAFGLLSAFALVVAACATDSGVSDDAQAEIDALMAQLDAAREEGSDAVAELEAALAEAQAEVGEVPEAAAGECCEVYRIALFEDPVSTNFWNYLGPGSSVWTQYVISGTEGALYTLSDQRFDFVPSLAENIVDPVQEGDVWTFTVPMVQDAEWSDGQPITANDVVFTHNTCADLKLTQNWPNQCAPTGLDITAEAVDDFTVKYTFPEQPSLGTWQAGVALAPILPEHFWGEMVAEARVFIEGISEPAAERTEDCEADGLSSDEAAACEEWATYDEAIENARKTLYEADATGSPVAGGYTVDKWEPGAFAERKENAGYYFKDARIIEHADGTWILEQPNGRRVQLYGDATDAVLLDFIGGPYSPNIVFSIYGSQDAAFLALADGEVDYVLNPLGLARGLREQAEKGEGIKTYTNADYGMFYLAFNMRKAPFDDPAFREAFDIIIDKEFVVNSVLAGVVFPMYSTMPPGNGFWHNPAVQENDANIGLSRQERVDKAVGVLKDAGWSWTQDPAWDEDLQDVVPGEGLLMPNGQPMPETTILGPGPAYDPLRATFNQWISEWARELGMPVTSELTGFNTILGPVFVDANYDMYILGWSLGNVAFPDYFESFWHSRNDTAVTGNYNTPGLNNALYDALVDEFMTTSSLEDAQRMVFEMQELLAEVRPYIPLFYKQVTDLARDNVVFPYTETLGGLVDLQGLQTDSQILSR